MNEHPLIGEEVDIGWRDWEIPWGRGRLVSVDNVWMIYDGVRNYRSGKKPSRFMVRVSDVSWLATVNDSGEADKPSENPGWFRRLFRAFA